MFLLESFPPDATASAQRMKNMVATYGMQKNTSVRVIVYNPNSHFESRDNFKNIEIARHGLGKLPKVLYLMPSINLLVLLKWILITIKEVANYKPDMLITTIPTFTPTIAAYISYLIFGTPFCVDFRDNELHPKTIDYYVNYLPPFSRPICKPFFYLFQLAFLQSFKNAFVISTVYEAMIEDLQRQTEFKVPIILIPNGVDFLEINAVQRKLNRQELAQIYKLNADKIIIYVGQVGGYYKPEILLDPIKRLKDRGINISYIIVGSGSNEDYIKKLAVDKDISDNIYVLGKKSHAEVLELISISDMAFYPLENGFPYPNCALGSKVLEYIGCKLPILSLANDDSIVSKLISDHKLGITLNWNELPKIEDSILEILYTSEYRRNVEEYYKCFFNEYDRTKNSQKLFNYMIECYMQRIKCRLD